MLGDRHDQLLRLRLPTVAGEQLVRLRQRLS
jgi:hypothetical protein